MRKLAVVFRVLDGSWVASAFAWLSDKPCDEVSNEGVCCVGRFVWTHLSAGATPHGEESIVVGSLRFSPKTSLSPVGLHGYLVGNNKFIVHLFESWWEEKIPICREFI